MLWNILKKDFIKRKSINLILFLFIILATLFLCSSVNNIKVTSSALSYYVNKAKVPDINFITNTDKDRKEIETYLEKKKEEGTIERYARNHFIVLNSKDLKAERDGKTVEIADSRGSLYVSALDVDFVLAFDQKGNPLELKDNEIGLSHAFMKKNNLQLGDTLILKGEKLIITQEVKDAAFGSDIVGMTRFLVSENTFKKMEPSFQKLRLYYVDAHDPSIILKELKDISIPSIINIVEKGTYAMAYSFDMMTAALFIAIGICFILISLLVLRFTLVFTMEEQYQEIGILKVIGLRDLAIKKLYLMKYFVIVSIGACIGLMLSIPLSSVMIESVSENMLMESSEANFGINVLCAAGIVLLVLAFCYFCTRKLHKISAITAIRGGQSGERFHDDKCFSLSKCKHLPLPVYLGMHDIVTHVKRYAVLIITFCISFILITIPLNTVNTMRSDEMSKRFTLDPSSNIIVKQFEQDQKPVNITELKKDMDMFKEQLNQKGYKAQMSAVPLYFIRYGKTDAFKHSYLSIQLVGDRTSYLEYEEGNAPELENEVAFSKKAMEDEGWVIGDQIIANINGVDRKMLISGVFSDYMQMGSSARLSPVINCDKETLFDYWNAQLYIDSDLSDAKLLSELQKVFPHQDFMNAQTFINQNIGGIQDALDQMLIPMTAMLCAVIMLITFLMEKLFIAREKGEIAMMKSIGIPYKTIRLWQLTRMVFVALCSMLIAIPLSYISNQFILKPIFAVMGAEVKIQVDALQAYGGYPGVLLIGIIIATLVATYQIKRIDIKEMNNLE